jgi:cyclopropane-fatty-acyl-phospholipid synthase
MSSKETIKELLDKADIQINGDRPWDIQVHNEKVYGRILSQGSLGAGESYMDGWWDVDALDVFFHKVLRSGVEKRIRLNPVLIFSAIYGKLVNLSKLKPFQVGEDHYDIGNELYTKMLDKRLTYTCGYWKEAKTLDEAQEAKLDLVCRKLNIKKGDKVLDIGSGWGSFINYAAKNYGAECVGLTISKEQAEYANANTNGLPVETRLQDYLDVEGEFDHIVSLGMFEHVGKKNYKIYMKKVRSLLKEDGLFLLHTIGRSTTPISSGDPWFSKYIFPNSMLPSIDQIMKAANKVLIMEDVHNFGSYYDNTLMEWWKNFDGNWETLKKDYDERFYRMWRYYLLSCAGSFRARRNHLWQVVFSKKGIEGGYESIR